jgi:hypothetical protein
MTNLILHPYYSFFENSPIAVFGYPNYSVDRFGIFRNVKFDRLVSGITKAEQ